MAEDTATTTSTTEEVTTTTSTTEAREDASTTTSTTSASDKTSTSHEPVEAGKTGEEAAPDDETAERLADARETGLRNAAQDVANNPASSDPEHLRQKAQVEEAAEKNKEHDEKLAAAKEEFASGKGTDSSTDKSSV